MQDNLLPALVENPHLAAVPAHPDPVADVFGRDGIIGFVYLNIAVAVHGSLAFLKAGEQIRWQGQEGRLFFGEQSGHLLARGAMNAHVRHRLLPVPQKLILRGEAGKSAPAQRIGLQVTNAPLRLTFVFWSSGPTGHQGAAIVTAEAQQFGIEDWIAPIHLLHRRAQVVEVQNLHDPAETAERVFQATDQVLGRLMEDCFAICLARVTQHHAQYPRPATTTLRLRHWRPGAEIDLGFFAGLDLDPPHSLGLCLAELTHETFD